MTMGYRVFWNKRALNQLKKLPLQTRALVFDWVKNELDGCKNPRSLPNAKPLKGNNNAWRWRIGSYRILGTIDDGTVTIELFRAGHRRDVYRQL